MVEIMHQFLGNEERLGTHIPLLQTAIMLRVQKIFSAQFQAQHLPSSPHGSPSPSLRFRGALLFVDDITMK